VDNVSGVRTGCSRTQALKRNARVHACKRFGVGVEAEEPILAPRSHAASRQGAARTPSVSAGGARTHGRPQRALQRTRRNDANACIRTRHHSGLTQARANLDQLQGVRRLPQTIWFHNKKGNAAAPRAEQVPPAPLRKEISGFFHALFSDWLSLRLRIDGSGSGSVSLKGGEFAA
jgi:hypothetical protein